MAARPAVIAAFARAGLTADPRPDNKLLADFFTDRDEAAFAEIVHRHQRTVWGVCRRLLSNSSDAEDAFQATFLVLARRGRTLADRGTVGGWLYRVAQKVAIKARAKSAKRQQHEAAVSRQEVAPETPTSDTDLLAVIGEELDRLPEKDRQAIIVCDLDGLSRADAAVRLGWNEGTLSARLHRARKKLAEALRHRGITAPATVAAILTSVAAPANLLANTMDLIAVGSLRVVPTAVATLVHSTLREMTMRFTSKVLTTLLVTTSLLGSVWFGLPNAAPTVSAAPVPEKPAAEKLPVLPLPAYAMLSNRKVLKELKCTPEQRVNIEDYFDEQMEKQQNQGVQGFDLQIGPGANPAQIQEQIQASIQARKDEQGKMARAAGEKFLSVKQLVRLGQIEIQSRGSAAFTDAKLTAPLKLSADQKKLIDEAVEEAKPNGVEAGPGPAGVINFNIIGGAILPDPLKEKAAVEKIQAALTKEQLAEWNKIVGDKVGFETQAQSLGGAWGGGGGGGVIVAPRMLVPGAALPIPAAPPKKDKE